MSLEDKVQNLIIDEDKIKNYFFKRESDEYRKIKSPDNFIESTIGYFAGEIVYQGANVEYSTAQAKVKEWNKSANTLNIINISGNFTTGRNLIGTMSDASYQVVGTDPFGDFSDYDLYNNKQFMSEANNYIDLSQKNPFGMP